MKSQIEKRREDLISCVPDVFDYRTVLYIGCKKGRSQFLSDFRDSGYTIDIVEPYKPNYEYCLELDWVRKVSLCTIQNYQSPSNSIDVVFWWHGPEHITKEEIIDTLARLEDIAKEYVVLGCPWGKYEQGEIGGNEFEHHLTHWYPEDFEKLGYRTSTIGKKDRKGSNLLSWKKI